MLDRWRRKPTVPRRTWKRSSWYGCRWADATKPVGWTNASTTTSSPFVSCAVLRNTRRSPVAWFSMESPWRITELLLSLWEQRQPPRTATSLRTQYLTRLLDQHLAADDQVGALAPARSHTPRRTAGSGCSARC